MTCAGAVAGEHPACPAGSFQGKGACPMTAADAFPGRHPDFEADTSIDDKLLISVALRATSGGCADCRREGRAIRHGREVFSPEFAHG